jgi:hypothetical protein
MIPDPTEPPPSWRKNHVDSFPCSILPSPKRTSANASPFSPTCHLPALYLSPPADDSAPIPNRQSPARSFFHSPQQHPLLPFLESPSPSPYATRLMDLSIPFFSQPFCLLIYILRNFCLALLRVGCALHGAKVVYFHQTTKQKSVIPMAAGNKKQWN